MKNGILIMVSLEEVINQRTEPKSFTRRLIKVTLPISIAALIYSAFAIQNPQNAQIFIQMLSAYVVPFVGTPASVAAGLNAGLEPAVVVFWLTVVESCGAFLVWLNFRYFERIPWIGRLLVRAEKQGRRYAENRDWVKKFRILGIVGFVLIPIEGAGAFSAPILGKFLGAEMWEVLIAVIIAAVIRFGAWTGGVGTVMSFV